MIIAGNTTGRGYIERPILFSTPMVQAILAGRKRVTRRLLHPKRRCPYGAPGDRLWVKETFTHITGNGIRLHYKADGWPVGHDGKPLPQDPGCRTWMPSIFMPRISSRITLGVVSVRVEPLQDITEDDAKAEGVLPFFEVYDRIGRDQRICTGELARDYPYRASFACLWDEINGDRALWNSNPDVHRVEFDVLSIEHGRVAA